MRSSFFAPGSTTKEGDLALLHLSRDQQLPVTLTKTALEAKDQGYAEGAVTNTKFGSFPHSTLIDVPWGRQVLASKVDTGTRGRIDGHQGRKRKANAISTDSPGDGTNGEGLKEATTATSGFIHVLPPTPESWTTSLPHRTQVVYTPDYSYILQRIRARPGGTLVEAGSGSGSFTHAAARAVFNYTTNVDRISEDPQRLETAGRVFTFEFHAERHEKVKAEMKEHGLDSIVSAMHRDVYKDGFWVKTPEGQNVSPRANAIFLDLPAPWEALPHLTRQENADKPSALDPSSPVHICSFSPCIEQVQKTVSVMRRQGWLEIEMVEIQHKRIDIKREYTGLRFEGMRGVNAVAVTVEEALTRLRDVEDRAREHHGTATGKQTKGKTNTQRNNQESAVQKFWDEGALVHRSEPELKTHTSYLVFAVLPREWSEEDEENLPVPVQQSKVSAATGSHSRKQMKKEVKQGSNLSNGNDQPPVDAPDGL